MFHMSPVSLATGMVSAVACLFAVDFITGVIHWLEDTWTALGRSKLLDRYVVRDNIEHHRKARAIRWLQRCGILQSPAHHAEHHKRPYANRYCTTTNFLNPVLDDMHFWRGLEWLIEHCGMRVQRATQARQGY